MKKFLILVAVAAFSFNVYAQDGGGALSKGSKFFEINTGSFVVGSTSFSLTSIDGNTAWSIGAEGGYFVIDNLAIKGGLGYSDSGSDGPGSTSFVYKIGSKYFIIDKIPVGVDFTGASFKDFDENPSYLGIEGGYAWFITDHISLEPKLRYNISMNSDFYDDAFQALVGFAFYF